LRIYKILFADPHIISEDPQKICGYPQNFWGAKYPHFLFCGFFDLGKFKGALEPPGRLPLGALCAPKGANSDRSFFRALLAATYTWALMGDGKTQRFWQ